jgi:hypothetical protein
LNGRSIVAAQVHVYGDEGGVRFGFGDRHDWRERDLA